MAGTPNVDSPAAAAGIRFRASVEGSGASGWRDAFLSQVANQTRQAAQMRVTLTVLGTTYIATVMPAFSTHLDKSAMFSYKRRQAKQLVASKP